jgi:hypothetical protein
MYDSALPVEGQQAVEDITDMLATFIDGSMHSVVSKELLSMTN